MPEVNLQEFSMAHKPYHDPREQTVTEPIARTAEEEVRRIYGIEAVGELITEHGTTKVLSWTFLTPPDPLVAPLVEEFGTELVKRWINYYVWREPRYLTPSLHRQVLSQVKERS